MAGNAVFGCGFVENYLLVRDEFGQLVTLPAADVAMCTLQGESRPLVVVE
jgi:hypothetical protein